MNFHKKINLSTCSMLRSLTMGTCAGCSGQWRLFVAMDRPAADQRGLLAGMLEQRLHHRLVLGRWAGAILTCTDMNGGGHLEANMAAAVAQVRTFWEIGIWILRQHTQEHDRRNTAAMRESMFGGRNTATTTPYVHVRACPQIGIHWRQRWRPDAIRDYPVMHVYNFAHI
jgi:hypothetical protein